MDSEQRRMLVGEMETGGRAYIRNLVAAEFAVLRGQFNVAKILRAAAHAQRVIAMQAGRALHEDQAPADLFVLILSELDAQSDRGGLMPADSAVDTMLEQTYSAKQRLGDILRRARASLENNSDVLESDVQQFLWACHSCGAVIEGDRPHACPVCGALSVEFEGFGPFYSATSEHLGQLNPGEIVLTLEATPDEVEAVIAHVDEAILGRKPSANEWCVKEIFGHMLETDLLFGRRVRRLLESQGAPDLTTPIPPWKLHEGKGYETMPAPELLERMRQARSASLALVRTLTPEHWSRRGAVSGNSTSMLDLGTWLANHDRGHLAQIQRLCGDER